MRVVLIGGANSKFGAEGAWMAGTVQHFVVEPMKRVGPIQFGMHKDEVSRAFTCVYSSFFKGPDSKVRSDHCEAFGLIIHYDDTSKVNFIEVHKPQYASVSLELFGRDISGISVRDLVSFLSGRGVRTERAYYGYEFPELGLSTYNHDLQSEDDPVECLAVGRSELGEQDAEPSAAPDRPGG